MGPKSEDFLKRPRLVIVLTLTLAPCFLSSCARKKAGPQGPSPIDEALTPKGASWPRNIAETYLFSGESARQPSAFLEPYTVKVPLWTDGEEKERFIYIPQGTAITSKVNPTSSRREFEFPIGTTLVKNFYGLDESASPIETRIITRKEDGRWSFATYVWNDQGAAELNTRPRKITKSGHEYRIPSEQECLLCHNKENPTLGFSPEQLNHKKTSVGAHQINELAAKQILDYENIEELKLQDLPDPNDDSLSIDVRTRAYMDVNCGTCHYPKGPDKANLLDLRFEAKDTRLLAEKKLVPGQPDQSLIVQRLTSSINRMPLISLRVDPKAQELIRKYVEQYQP